MKRELAKPGNERLVGTPVIRFKDEDPEALISCFSSHMLLFFNKLYLYPLNIISVK
jgi:hypothetical protein